MLTLTINIDGFDGYIGALRLYKKSFGMTAVYDDKGNIIGQSNGTSSSSFKYNGKNQLIDVRNSQGVAYDIKYDTNGDIVSSTGTYGIKTENEYDENGNLKLSKQSAYNALNEIEYTYDENGFLSSKTDELGYKEEYEYDSVGKILKSTDALSRVSQYKYDQYMNCLLYTSDAADEL